MEWDRLHSVDLLVMFRSFAPDPEDVLKVSVYASEFGKQRMAEEAQFGPVGEFQGRVWAV